MSSLKGQRALITGATRGIGAAVAERYAREGADLILIGRSIESLERIDDQLASYGVSVTLVPLDLRNSLAIEEMAHKIAARFGCLDILVGNAGVLGALMPLTHVPVPIWEEVWQVNCFANWHLLKAFEPLLLKAPAGGRALFVTSGVAQGEHPFWGPYSLSKKALEEMVRLYVSENPDKNLKVNLINPGAVRTAMQVQVSPGIDPENFCDPKEITQIFVDLAAENVKTTGQVFQAQKRNKSI